MTLAMGTEPKKKARIPAKPLHMLPISPPNQDEDVNDEMRKEAARRRCQRAAVANTARTAAGADLTKGETCTIPLLEEEETCTMPLPEASLGSPKKRRKSLVDELAFMRRSSEASSEAIAETIGQMKSALANVEERHEKSSYLCTLASNDLSRSIDSIACVAIERLKSSLQVRDGTVALSKWNRKWKWACHRVVTQMDVEKTVGILKEKGYPATYWGRTTNADSIQQDTLAQFTAEIELRKTSNSTENQMHSKSLEIQSTLVGKSILLQAGNSAVAVISENE